MYLHNNVASRFPRRPVSTRAVVAASHHPLKLTRPAPPPTHAPAPKNGWPLASPLASCPLPHPHRFAPAHPSPPF